MLLDAETITEYSNPTELVLACGHSIPNEAGTPYFNYYDGVFGKIARPATKPDVDTSGQLPNGITYWFADVDNSRAVCEPCGHERKARKGW